MPCPHYPKSLETVVISRQRSGVPAAENMLLFSFLFVSLTFFFLFFFFFFFFFFLSFYVCDLHSSAAQQQRRILNPLREARDLLHILMDTSPVLNLLSHSRNSLDALLEVSSAEHAKLLADPKLWRAWPQSRHRPVSFYPSQTLGNDATFIINLKK